MNVDEINVPLISGPPTERGFHATCFYRDGRIAHILIPKGYGVKVVIRGVAFAPRRAEDVIQVSSWVFVGPLFEEDL